MSQTDALTFGPFVLDPVSGLLTRDGVPVPLTPRAFEVLEYLARRPGQLVPKQELLDAAWAGTFVGDGALKVCIREIRKALGDDAKRPADVLYRLIDRTIRRRAFTRRVVGVGGLQQSAAANLGLAGPAGRASGIQRDLRVDAPYAAYAEVKPAQVTQTGGDTYARIMLLLLEAYDSLQVVLRLLEAVPEGDWSGDVLEAVPSGRAEVLVEAPAGPLRYALTSDGTRLTALTIEAIGPPDRLAWRALLAGQQVEDAAMIIASVGACTACAEV